MTGPSSLFHQNIERDLLDCTGRPVTKSWSIWLFKQTIRSRTEPHQTFGFLPHLVSMKLALATALVSAGAAVAQVPVNALVRPTIFPGFGYAYARL